MNLKHETRDDKGRREPKASGGTRIDSTGPDRRVISDAWGWGACIAVACLVAALSWFKLSSLDLGYHIGYGRHFLDAGEIVGKRPDPFLYPETAISFVNANWGSQVVMALFERAGGAAGLTALRIGLLVVIFAAIAYVMRRLGSSWLAVAAAWLLAALAAYERFSMRPELFSYALMMGQLAILVRGLRTWKSAIALVLMQIAWVNAHGYFLVGLFLSGSFLVGGLVSRKGVAPDARRRSNRLLAGVLALQVAVCCLNPWGVRGALFPVYTLDFLRAQDVMGGAAGDASTSAWSEISEFQSPFSFGDESISGRTISAYWVLLTVTGVGLAAAVIGRRFVHVALLVVFLAMSTQMRRNIAQYALVGAPPALAAIVAMAPWSRLDASLRRFLRPAAAVLLIGLSAWWCIGVVNGRFYYVERRLSREFGLGYSERTFQRKAVDWLSTNPDLQPRLYVDYFSSSNTLRGLPERFQLFVDTNTFAYKDETLRRAFDVGLTKADHRGFFDEYGINTVMLRAGPDTQLLIRALAGDEQWPLVYFDRSTVIFVRRMAEHESLIRAHAPGPRDLEALEWIEQTPGPAYARALTLGTVINVPMALGWWPPASRLAREACKLAPDYHEAWHYLGVCEANMGKAAARARRMDVAREHWEKAVRCFRNVLALHPGHLEAERFYRETKSVLEDMP